MPYFLIQKWAVAPPLALRLRLTMKQLTRKHQKRWKRAKLQPLCWFAAVFCGHGYESGRGQKFLRALRAQLFYISPLPWKILYPPLLTIVSLLTRMSDDLFRVSGNDHYQSGCWMDNGQSNHAMPGYLSLHFRFLISDSAWTHKRMHTHTHTVCVYTPSYTLTYSLFWSGWESPGWLGTSLWPGRPQ